MRDLALFLIIFGSVPIILARPWIGVIMWSWVSFANPHRMTWGMMYDMPVAFIIGGATLIGWVLCREDRTLQNNVITASMILLLAWTGLTTLLAVEADFAQYKWNQFFKTIFMTLVALTLIKTQKRFNCFVWIGVLSIGYFSFKGGIFTLTTGGQYLVWGPPDTTIEDNNALAMATLMIMPLMIYLAQTATNRWIRIGMYACALFSLISVFGSYSRGGFVGMAAILIAVWWQAKNKVVIGAVATITVIIGVALVPQQWLDRMNTITNYEEDSSATGRLEIWGHAIRVANDKPLVGGGFGIFDDEATYFRLSPVLVTKRNVHSIYFEMLGTQGYVGLIIFLVLGAGGLTMSGKILRRTRGVPGLEQEYKFARAIQISLIAYAVCGTFQNLSTWDLYYALLAMVVMQRSLLEKKLASGSVTNAPATEPDQLSLGTATTHVPLPQYMPGRSFLRRPAT